MARNDGELANAQSMEDTPVMQGQDGHYNGQYPPDIETVLGMDQLNQNRNMYNPGKPLIVIDAGITLSGNP